MENKEKQPLEEGQRGLAEGDEEGARPVQVSRRGFLIGAGAGVVATGAAAAGYITLTPPKQVEVIKEVPKEVIKEVEVVKEVVKEVPVPAEAVSAEPSTRLRTVTLNVNGQDFELEVEAHWTLARVLRDSLALTGTKMACDHGMCGACTILVNGTPVYACMQLAIREAGKEILTVEGLAQEGKLHPLQAAFIEGYGTQCGYCASGFLVTAKALLDANPDPTVGDIKEALGGNLCRCGSYHEVITSVLAAAKAMRA